MTAEQRDLWTMLRQYKEKYEELKSDCHDLDNRVVKLEESIGFIKDDLSSIKTNSCDMKKSLSEIREQFKFHEGSSDAKKTGWKILGYIITVLATLGVHHIFLKWFDIHL